MQKTSFTYDELIACARGDVFGDGNPQLPLPPMLMFDRIVQIDEVSGRFERGVVIAELDIKPDLWFFACHFNNDPVMPGCLGLDALWQLLGFYLGWLGQEGRGRARGAGKVRFSGQILPTTKLVRFQIDIKRIVKSTVSVGLANGRVFADDECIYDTEDLRVGLIKTAI